MKVLVYSKSDTSVLLERMRATWPADLIPKIKTIKAYEIEDGLYLLTTDDFNAVQIADKYILPFLGDTNLINRFPSVTVDMGAVKYICNGARVMRPGITRFDSFNKGDIVVIKDQIHGKALATGIALESSENAAGLSKGYIVENLHYVGDSIWNANKQIGS